MKNNYELRVKEINEWVQDFETYDEAKEVANRLEIDDFDTNVKLTYEIVLKEDAIDNKRIELEQLIETQKELLYDIKHSLENYIYDINNLQ